MEETAELLKVERMTPAEVATILNTTAETVRAGIRQGKFPFALAIQGNTGQWIYLIIKSKFLLWAKEMGISVNKRI